jgi:serine/threonine protein kinase
MQKRFNHYCLTEQIGSKPLRSVYLAHHVKDVSHKVLLKIFDAPCLALGQESERFLQQVEWIKQLRHAHVVPILDLGVEQGQPYVVSTYLASGSLRRRLDSLSPKRLSLPEALKIISQVGQALAYFHEHANLHENIKPENIFFDEQGEVLLADFRLSGFIDVKLLDYQSDSRSMCYMAPEQFAGTASEKSDQYALACLAYELITGQKPFSAQSFAMMWASHYAEVPAPLTDLVPSLPQAIEKAVFKAMAKNPSERYPNISAFVRTLEGIALAPTAAITKPLSISSLDPFAANVVRSLASRQSNAPMEISLVGSTSEGSLVNAPFGTSMIGVSFAANLAGAPFEGSMVGVPFGTSMVGNPFGVSIVDSSFGASMAGTPFETSQGGTSLDLALGDNPFEMMLVDTPLTTRLLERWEHVSNEPTKTTDALAGSSYNSMLPQSFRYTKYSIPVFLLGKPHQRSNRIHRLIRLKGYVKSSLTLFRGQDRNYSPIALWFVLAMTIMVLIGGVISDTFLAPHSSGSNSYQKQLIIIDTKDIPINTRLLTQPVAHGTVTTPHE